MPSKEKSSSREGSARVDEEREASGRVASLGYDVHGDIDGYHLDDATFLHVNAAGAKRYDVQVGETVKAKGVMVMGHDGSAVLEVRTIERVELLGKRHGTD